MGPPKRDAGGSVKLHQGQGSTSLSNSPYMPMFEQFRDQLDEHHDRRERIIKASRDITALAKKMIFTLQRVRCIGERLPASIVEENAPRAAKISSLLGSLAPDLSGIDSWRYRKQISPGLQEFFEAAVFQHYLETQTLMRPMKETIASALASTPQDLGLFLVNLEADWLLGVFDAVGEMMRWIITNMASSRGTIPKSVSSSKENLSKPEGECRKMDIDENTRHFLAMERNALTDIRELRAWLENLRVKGSVLDGELARKITVMRTCVEKVEVAACGLIVRGNERPKGWLPDDDGRQPDTRTEAVTDH